MQDTLVMILAGGEGRRLRPLTGDRAKPAVPFGGRYRLIDFVLSNFVNSGFYKIKVLTQYKADSLINHITRGWRLSPHVGHFVDSVPAQQRKGPHWYRGSADAIYQNLNLLEDARPKDVCVFGADHIYKMEARQMLQRHRGARAELTVAAIPVPIEQASAFGIMEVDVDGRIIGFQEKPADPAPMPGRPDYSLASMGNYIFEAQSLIREVTRDALDDESAHDFGKSIVSRMVRDDESRVFAYDFSTNVVPGQPEGERGYWRDVGTIDAYWKASMDLIAVNPVFDLYNAQWPVRTLYHHHAPAKFVHEDLSNNRVGRAMNSSVAEGCIVSGGTIRNCILSPEVRVNSYSSIEDSVLFERVDIGRRARIRRAIIDKGVRVPADEVIGYDLERDRQRFRVSEGGVVVVPKGYKFD